MLLTTLRTPARTTTDLIAYAESRGLTVAWVIDLPERGRYVADHRTILLREGMTRRRTHSTLAHEIAHDYWRDRCSSGHIEARAWRCAAQMLIHPEHYARAERLDPSAGAIAQELVVTTEVIHAYRQLLASHAHIIQGTLRGDANSHPR